MSEHLHHDEENVYLEFQSTEFECTPEATCVYLHEGAHQVFDHIFIQHQNDPNEPDAGIAFFRESLENFDETVEMMRERGFAFVEKDLVSNFDKEIYVAYFGHEPDLYSHLVKQYELTDRHERLVKHFGETMLAMPDDLLYDELTSGHNHPHTEMWTND